MQRKHYSLKETVMFFWSILGVSFLRGAIRGYKQHKAAQAVKVHRGWWN